MTLLDSIKQSLFPKRQLQPVLPVARHRFPYSEDKVVRREQVWLYEKPSDSFAMIREFLGTEEEGYGRFKDWKAKLTDVLGEPGRLELEPFGALEIGSVEWTFGKASVTLVGIEQFVGKYWLYAGLKK